VMIGYVAIAHFLRDEQDFKKFALLAVIHVYLSLKRYGRLLA
jgi:hypothetical protein